MACCVLLLRLLGLLAGRRRSGAVLGPGALPGVRALPGVGGSVRQPGAVVRGTVVRGTVARDAAVPGAAVRGAVVPPRLPVVALGVLGMAELGLGIVLARTWPRAAGGTTPHMSMPDTAMTHMSMAGMGAMTSSGTDGTEVWRTASGVVFAAVTAGLALWMSHRTADRRARLLAVAGVAGLLAVATLAGTTTGTGNEAVMMIYLETVLVAGPLAIVGLRWRTGPCDDLYAPVRSLLALLTCAATGVAFVAAHLPAGHTMLMGGDGVPWWVVGSAGACACAAWAAVSRFRLRPQVRLLALALMVETGMLIGIVTLWHGAVDRIDVTDNVLAGMIMVVGDLLVLVKLSTAGPGVLFPASSRVLRSLPGSTATMRTRPQSI